METWQKLWKATAGLFVYRSQKGDFFSDVEDISNQISCRYLGFKKTIQLDRKRLVELLDMHQNGTLAWNDFIVAVRLAHEKRMGQPMRRRVTVDKPKEEDYFYANPQECLCVGTNCDDLLGPGDSSKTR
jgi:hypothetical protein